MLTGLATATGTTGQLLPDLQFEEISLLPLDHPGAHDLAYRRRRDHIASLARQYRQDPQHVIPLVDYTDEEQSVWRHVSQQLDTLQARHACSLYLEAKQQLGISHDEIPQQRDVSARLQTLTNFHLAPIEGLVETRGFLSWLARRTMLCTQYVRHHSRPDYTPEPDVIHELIGHAPMFSVPDFADFSQAVGEGAIKANSAQLEQLGRLYWFTVEFGLIQEGPGKEDVKAFGAGLLSSFGELEHAFSNEVERRPFKLREVIQSSYDYSEMQPVLFIIPSYAYLKEVTREFIGRFGKTGDLELAPSGVSGALW